MTLWILLSTIAHAALPCAPRNAITGSSRAAIEGLTKVNVIDDADRRTAAQYAKEHPGETEKSIQDRYAATGDLNCPGGMSQANVTIKGDIITTAAHSIFAGNKSCGKKNEATKCKFVTEFEGKKETYDVESMLYTGYDCGMYSRVTGSDWAILKLKKAVDPRIKPYRFDKQLSMRQVSSSPVMAVGKSIDFPDLKTAATNAPRHFGDCEAKGGANFDFNFVQSTNCDLDHRASGGALLTRGPDPILLGVHEAITIGYAKTANNPGKKCPSATSKKSGAYSDCWDSTSTMITGDFAASLEEIQSSAPAAPAPARPSPSPEPAKPSSPPPAQIDL